jgi:hypothetical protein
MHDARISGATPAHRRLVFLFLAISFPSFVPGKTDFFPAIHIYHGFPVFSIPRVFAMFGHPRTLHFDRIVEVWKGLSKEREWHGRNPLKTQYLFLAHILDWGWANSTHFFCQGALS